MLGWKEGTYSGFIHPSWCQRHGIKKWVAIVALIMDSMATLNCRRVVWTYIYIYILYIICIIYIYIYIYESIILYKYIQNVQLTKSYYPFDRLHTTDWWRRALGWPLLAGRLWPWPMVNGQVISNGSRFLQKWPKDVEKSGVGKCPILGILNITL